MALHAHQPTGNLQEVFEEAHDACYRPILDAFERFPRVRLALHVSGPLLEWIEAQRPETIALAASLVSRGQVEILGGGWQEPILTVLPPHDALGQLRMMRYECARLFGALPAGMWLAERVWEPELPALLSDAGYRYTFVDDTHLRYAGVLDEHVTGYHITEKHGKTVAVLPISKALRYAIPFRPPAETVRILSARPGELWTYGDDAEKFGLWPGTREWVWEKGWLEGFLERLSREQEEGTLETVLPSGALRSCAPAGRVYIPTASYREMGEWSLPARAASRLRSLRTALEEHGLEAESEPFVRGGCWSGFLAKYPEANWLHKRMLRVSAKVAGAERRDRRTVGGLTPAVEEARRDLYRSQTNCAYWHGLFGGLYLPHLRRALWLHLLRAENAVDPVDEGIRLTRTDLDCDGSEEILVETKRMTLAVAPAAGGCLAEIVDRRACLDLTDVLARRPELYHEREEPGAANEGEAIDTIHSLKKELSEEMKARLAYDALPRRAFQEALLPPDAEIAALEDGRITPLLDLASLEWTETSVEERTDALHVSLERRQELAPGTLTVSKRYVVHGDGARLTVHFTLDWDGPEPLEAVLATSVNVNLLAGDAPDRYYELRDPATPLDDGERRLSSRGVWERTASVSLVDEHERVRVDLDCSPVCTLLRHPVETVSQTESGYQLTYQGSCLVLAWPLKLESWVDWKGRVRLEIA